MGQTLSKSNGRNARTTADLKVMGQCCLATMTPIHEHSNFELWAYKPSNPFKSSGRRIESRIPTYEGNFDDGDAEVCFYMNNFNPLEPTWSTPSNPVKVEASYMATNIVSGMSHKKNRKKKDIEYATSSYV